MCQAWLQTQGYSFDRPCYFRFLFCRRGNWGMKQLRPLSKVQWQYQMQPQKVRLESLGSEHCYSPPWGWRHILWPTLRTGLCPLCAVPLGSQCCLHISSLSPHSHPAGGARWGAQPRRIQQFVQLGEMRWVLLFALLSFSVYLQRKPDTSPRECAIFSFWH